MTDLDKFVELYRSLGIDVKVNATETGKDITLSESGGYDDMTTSDLFCGYSGFYTVIRFDNNGKFTKQGFYE